MMVLHLVGSKFVLVLVNDNIDDSYYVMSLENTVFFSVIFKTFLYFLL